MPTFEPRTDACVIFDIEARPTAWIGGDYVGRTMTAYAYSYLDEEHIASDAIRAGDRAGWERMVIHIASVLESSTMAVGHYIRGFDLDVINADLERIGQKSLPRLMTTDTKIDRLKGLGISESLENLMSRYDLRTEKMSMHEPWWDEFNCWQTERTRKLVLERVRSDVEGSKELYKALLAAGRLKTPAAWDPTTAKRPRYRA